MTAYSVYGEKGKCKEDTVLKLLDLEYILYSRKEGQGYSTSAFPPAASIFAAADALNIMALTVTGP